MSTVGIVCEYNPFHTGHKHQIDILHSMGYDCVICVMSGNFTQRGELAIFDKYTRAKSAVACGADVVIELPFPYSSLSAEGFAYAGVHILNSLGVDAISFGSESGDIQILERASNAVLSPDFSTIYCEMQKGGLGSAAAYFETVKKISGYDASLLSNDILAISYLAAIKKMNAELDIVPIKREGSAYNEKKLVDAKYPSASAIRETLKKSTTDFEEALDGHIPPKALSILSDAKNSNLGPVLSSKVDDDILSFFRFMTPSEICTRAVIRSGGGRHIAEDGCGICERICNAARSSKSFSEFIDACYTSKYTNARINRVLLFSLLGVSEKMMDKPPEYSILLAANCTGRDFLASARKKCSFPIVTKPADAPDNSVQKQISEFADNFYTFAMPTDTDLNFFIKSHPNMF